MTVTHDELMYLQAQLEGLESIFIELMPFGIELKRQQVQDFYDRRYVYATKINSPVADNELRRQFNTKANQVRNLVDRAESLGDAINKINLIRAAASLPEDRNRPLKHEVMQYCRSLVADHRVDPKILSALLTSPFGPVETRVILAATMFLTVDTVDHGGKPMSIKELLAKFVSFVKSGQLLSRNDPFLAEAICVLEGMEEDPG